MVSPTTAVGGEVSRDRVTLPAGGVGEPRGNFADLALVSAINMLILIADEYQRHFSYKYQEVMDSLASELKMATSASDLSIP